MGTSPKDIPDTMDAMMPTPPPAESAAPTPDRVAAGIPTADRLRGLAHPVRMRILAALRADGPATATALAKRLDLNSGATSYHLRQLATYGFIVEAAHLGNRRDRFWLVDPAQEELPTRSREGRAAHLQARLVQQAQAAQSAVESHAELPAVWNKATTFEAHELELTPAQAKSLLARIEAVIDEAGRAAASDSGEPTPPSKPNGKAADKRPFVVQFQGFVRPHAG